jgi:hypothetical protein
VVSGFSCNNIVNSKKEKMKKLSLLIVATLIVAASFSQNTFKVFGQAAFGLNAISSSVSAGGELQAGVRLNSFISSVGYISSFDRGFPELFNLRAGYMPDERYVLYAGYVRAIESSVMKKENFNTWQIGAQRNFSYYCQHKAAGTFYVSATYTNRVALSLNIGMTFNLVKRDDE